MRIDDPYHQRQFLVRQLQVPGTGGGKRNAFSKSCSDLISSRGDFFNGSGAEHDSRDKIARQTWEQCEIHSLLDLFLIEQEKCVEVNKPIYKTNPSRDSAIL